MQFLERLENVRNRRDVKLVVTEERRKKLVSEPNYDSRKVFSESLMAIEMRKTEVFIDKPIAVEQAALDISKTLMYEFWYECLKPKYSDNINLCSSIQTVLSFIFKLMVFTKVLVKM